MAPNLLGPEVGARLLNGEHDFNQPSPAGRAAQDREVAPVEAQTGEAGVTSGG